MIEDSQLPEGMRNCTIIFLECEKGHGRLGATNWVDHGCQFCEIERLRHALDGISVWSIDHKDAIKRANVALGFKPR